MNLFSPIIEDQRQHPSFRKIFVPRNRYALDVLTDWARGFVDRDGKFVKEFQSSFESSFWELYIFAVLKYFRFTVDFQHNRPDFIITSPTPFIIEATISLNDSLTRPAHDSEISDIPIDLNTFNEEAIIRLSNSFISKYRKFKSSYAQLGHVIGKPFLLAIAPFDRPFFNMQCQRAIEALLFGYYVDEEAYLKKKDFREKIKSHEIKEVIKHNGSLVEVGLFNNDRYKEVSAVLFNSCATWGKALALSQDPNSRSFFTALKQNKSETLPHVVREPRASYSEHLIDGVRIYHNPYSANLLPANLFRDRKVFQSYWDFSINEWVYEQHDGQLLFRSVITAISNR